MLQNNNKQITDYYILTFRINSLSQLEQLYDAKEYTKVADILKTTFGSCTSHPSCGRMGRPAQIGMLLHSLWYTDLTECFVWCEECLFESLSHFLTPLHMADKWEMVIQKCFLIMVEIIKKETVSIGNVHFVIININYSILFSDALFQKFFKHNY